MIMINVITKVFDIHNVKYHNSDANNFLINSCKTSTFRFHFRIVTICLYLTSSFEFQQISKEFFSGVFTI